MIIGAGAQGRVALDILRDCPEFDEYEFLDDNTEIWETLINGVPVKGSIAQITSYDKNKFKAVIALGNPPARKKLAELGVFNGIPFANIVHPTAYLASSASAGIGNTICAQAVVNSNVQLGKHGLINNAAVIEHDCCLGDYVTICAGALVGGRVELGDGCFISTGSILLPRIKIGQNAIVAAGSVVTKDVPANTLVMHSPAREKQLVEPDFNWKKLL